MTSSRSRHLLFTSLREFSAFLHDLSQRCTHRSMANRNFADLVSKTLLVSSNLEIEMVQAFGEDSVIRHGILAGIYLAKCRDLPSSQSLMCDTTASRHGS